MLVGEIRAKLASRLAKLSPYTMAIILLPLIVLWHRGNALYGPPWYADPWFYLGYFRNLAGFKQYLFFDFYYGSRLSWILPGFLIHSVFPPLLANGLLHLTVHIVATMSFFFTLKMIAGERRAFLATMVFSVQPWLWAATGWDYPDGAGIAYCLLAIALFTRSALRPDRKSLLLAGIALAGLAYTHLFLASLSPLLLVYFVGSVWVWHRMSPIRAATQLFLWAGAGFAAVTAAFCVINYLLDGNFWFYAPSLAQARTMSSNFMYVRSIWADWAGGQLVPWLWPAVGASCVAMLMLPSRLRRELKDRNAVALLLSALLLIAFGYMALLQSRGSTVLGHHPYVSYLLPFSFLVMGVSFWPAADTMSLPTYVVTCSAAAVVFAAIWFEPLGPLSPVAQQALLALCGTALVLALLFRQKFAGTLLAIAGFGAFCSLSLAQTTRLNWVDVHGNREQFQRIMRARERIEAIRKGSNIQFWYNDKDSSFFDYSFLNATYLAEFSRLGTNFPSGCKDRIDEGTLVVVTSQNPGAARVAETALTDCWSRTGLKPMVEEVDPANNGRPYTIAMLRAVYPHHFTAAFDSQGHGLLQPLESPRWPATLPLKRWIPFEGVTVRDSSDGIAVRTPADANAYTMTYAPLTAPEAGTYRFSLRFKLSSGEIAFGAFPPDNSRWLATDIRGRQTGEALETAITLAMKPGETVLLRIANHTATGRRSSFLLEQLDVVALDR